MGAAISGAAIIDDGKAVSVAFTSGERLRFHAVWLRDNALDPETRAANGQRLTTVNALPADLSVTAAEAAGAELRLQFGPEGHAATFPAEWLWAHAYDRTEVRPPGWTAPCVETWDAGLANRLRHHDFRIMTGNETAELAFLDDLVRLGLAVVTATPAKPEAIYDLARLVGPVRETNYGRLFDVRAEVAPVNLAYSGLGLQAHTDNPYRDPAPTIQILHCIENSVAGGDSSVVDGFAVARRLRQANARQFDLLSGHAARFRFNGDGVSDLNAKRPMIELGPDGELLAVRFNNRSAAPFTDIPYDQMADYYGAYRAMADLVDDPSMHVRFRLDPGMAFIVDNRRVMHARTEFSGTGSRWLQGCYCDMDSVNSRHAVLSASIR